MDKAQQLRFVNDEHDVDSQLYDNFVPDSDKVKMSLIRVASVDELLTQEPDFKDDRLSALLPLYKARNFPKTLSADELLTWERFRERKLLGGKQSSRMARYFTRLTELATQTSTRPDQQYILEELQLYAESIMPAELEAG